VDASAAKAASLGGTVILPGMDVFDSGRLAFIQDPTGAMFGLWQAKNHPGAGVLDEPGALCWTELMTGDTGKAKGFYTGLFGWQAEAMPMGPERTYTIFKRGEAQAGGMMQIAPEMGPVPPHWMIYFAVGDYDGMVAKAQGLGAGITVPGTDIPNIGRFAILSDPQGAHFAIIQLAGMP
jgi:predicted enzyme related to lactoylglutathione lyase